MTSEFTSDDLSSRQRYASNLFDQIGDRLEASSQTPQHVPPVSIHRPDAARFRIQTTLDVIELEANDPIGFVTLKHFAMGGASTVPAHSGIVELSDCHYPWDCKVAFTGCEWLGFGTSAADAASSTETTKPALNEHGDQIAAALIKMLFNPEGRVL